MNITGLLRGRAALTLTALTASAVIITPDGGVRRRVRVRSPSTSAAASR